MALAAARFSEAEPSDVKFARTGLWCSIAAFITWFGMGVESIMRPWQDNRRDTFWLLPFCFTMAAFICVHRVQRGRSRTEAIGFWIVMAASALVLAGSIGLQLNIAGLKWLGFPGGAMVWLVGLVCFGIGTLMARTLPWYAGVALILFEPASILAAFALRHYAPLLERGAYSGNVGKGLAMLVIAFALRSYIRATAMQDAFYSRLVSTVQTRS